MLGSHFGDPNNTHKGNEEGHHENNGDRGQNDSPHQNYGDHIGQTHNEDGSPMSPGALSSPK